MTTTWLYYSRRNSTTREFFPFPYSRFTRQSPFRYEIIKLKSMATENRRCFKFFVFEAKMLIEIAAGTNKRTFLSYSFLACTVISCQRIVRICCYSCRWKYKLILSSKNNLFPSSFPLCAPTPLKEKPRKSQKILIIIKNYLDEKAQCGKHLFCFHSSVRNNILP